MMVPAARTARLMRPRPAASAPFYGWYVIGALFFSTALGIGLRQAFGIFVDTWEREFSTTVGVISIAASIGWFSNGASQVLMGSLIDRFGGRVVVTGSAVVFGVSAALMAAANNVLVLAVVYGAGMSRWPRAAWPAGRPGPLLPAGFGASGVRRSAY